MQLVISNYKENQQSTLGINHWTPFKTFLNFEFEFWNWKARQLNGRRELIRICLFLSSSFPGDAKDCLKDKFTLCVILFVLVCIGGLQNEHVTFPCIILSISQIPDTASACSFLVRFLEIRRTAWKISLLYVLFCLYRCALGGCTVNVSLFRVSFLLTLNSRWCICVLALFLFVSWVSWGLFERYVNFTLCVINFCLYRCHYIHYNSQLSVYNTIFLLNVPPLWDPMGPQELGTYHNYVHNSHQGSGLNIIYITQVI